MTAKGRRTDAIITGVLGNPGVGPRGLAAGEGTGRAQLGTAQEPSGHWDARGGDIGSLAEANRFLTKYWAPLWNERLRRGTQGPMGAHRPLPLGVDLSGAAHIVGVLRGNLSTAALA